MSLGDVLQSVGKWFEGQADSTGASQGPDAFALKQTSNLLGGLTRDPAQAQATASAVLSGPGGAAALGGAVAMGAAGTAFGAAQQVPYLGDALDNTMHWLNYGNRAVNTLLITAAHSGASSNGDVTRSMGEFLNSDAWSKAWKVTDDQGDGGVTGGQVLANNLFGDANLDPLNPADVQKIQDNALSSWYGSALSVTSDLATSFIGPPGLGAVGKVAGAARDARTVDTLLGAGGAEAIAKRAAEQPVLNGVMPSAFQKMKDTVDVLSPFGQQNLDSIVQRQVSGLRMFEGVTDPFEAMRLIKKTVHAGDDHMLSQVATVMTEINKIPGVDVATRDRLRLNTAMSLLGSQTAKAELIRQAPLFARSVENLTTNPIVNDVATEFWLRSIENPDKPVLINDVIDSHLNLKPDMAEAKALADNLEAAQGALNNVRDFLRTMPKVTREGADQLKLAQATARTRVNLARAELADATRAHMHARNWTAAAADNLVNSGLNDVAGFNRIAGGAEARMATDAARATDAKAGVATAIRDVKDASMQARWVDAEFNQAKALVADVGKSKASAALKAKVAALGSELDAAKATKDAATAARVRAGIVQEIRKSDAAGAGVDKAILDSAVKLEKQAREAVKSSGQMSDVEVFNQALGETRLRMEQAQKELEAARRNRDLLTSTPSPGGPIDPARAERKQTRAALKEERDRLKRDRDYARALKESYDLGMRTLEAKKVDVMSDPALAGVNQHINTILDIASPDYVAGGEAGFTMSAFQRGVEYLRDHYGAETYVIHGKGNALTTVRSLPGPKSVAALRPHARGEINVHEVFLGARQLEDALRRSKVMDPAEVRAARTELVASTQQQRALVVEKWQDIMLTRIAEKHIERWGARGVDGELLTGEAALKEALDMVAITKHSWGQGRAYVVKQAAQQDGKLTLIRDESGAVVAYDSALLKPHLADNVPFVDPHIFNRELHLHQQNWLRAFGEAGSKGIQTLDYALRMWKHSALLRPGLAVRSYLDTGPRAIASMGAISAFQSSIIGMGHLLHNANGSKYLRAKLKGLPPEEVAAQAMYLGLKPVKVGKHEFQMVQDRAELQRVLMAANKGNTFSGSLLADATRNYGRLEKNAESWVHYEPTSQRWNMAYQNFSQELLASPTARKIADIVHAGPDAKSIDDVMEGLLHDPEVLAEYRKIANPLQMDEAQFVGYVWQDVANIFPTKAIYDAARNGGATERFLDKHFPVYSRPTIPAPEIRATGGPSALFKKATDKAYAVLLDKPDMWLARNPTTVHVYKTRVEREVKAMMKERGKDGNLTAAEMDAIHLRARQHAVNYVRDTFFDTSRYTGIHAALGRIAPFFNAWEDSLASWGKLVYRNPQILARLQAAYHAPFVIQDSLRTPLVVDENGNPVGRDNTAKAEYVRVPLKALGAAVGFKNLGNYNIRLSSFNSISFGDNWAAPGVGPLVTVPAQAVMSSNPKWAIAVEGWDNPIANFLKGQVFFGGDVRTNDATGIAASTLPPWLRNFQSNMFGEGHMQATQTYFNFKVAQANAWGISPSQKELSQYWEEAQKAADNAAWVHLIGQAGLGMSGKAQVDGQFYVDQLHIAQALTPEQRGGLDTQAFMVQKFPEIAGLDFSIRRNESGINASVRAEGQYQNMKSLIENQPAEAGWMLVGAENLVDPQFSTTAYSLQTQRGARQNISEREAQEQAMAAAGWRQYDAMTAEANAILAQRGYGENSKQAQQVRRAIRETVMQSNTYFAKDYSQITRKSDTYTSVALQMSDPKNGPLRKRSDMIAFRDYWGARQEVLDRLGIKSLSGNSAKYDQAKAILNDLGQTMSARDLGFSQMWSRWLSREVED